MSTGGRAAVCVAALAFVLTGCGHGIPTASTPQPADLFGMNAQRLPAVLAAGQVAFVSRSAEEMKALGVEFVRAGIDWAALEPSPASEGGTRYDFDDLDRWVAVLSRSGIEWQPIGIGVPPAVWALEPGPITAGCGAASPPRPAAYAEMMAAIAARYGTQGSFWTQHPDLPPEPVTTFEIWNEPNASGFWCPRPDPGAYARLFVATEQSVHQVDPSAALMFAGMAPIRGDHPQDAETPAQVGVARFIAEALAAEPSLASKIDAVAVHPYASTPNLVLETTRWFRAVLDSVGLSDIPMSVNEYGWPTGGPPSSLPPIPESTRARYMFATTTALAASSCGLSGIAPHTWYTQREDRSSALDWFGLVDPASGDPYPSALAYGKAVLEGEGAADRNRLQLCP